MSSNGKSRLTPERLEELREMLTDEQKVTRKTRKYKGWKLHIAIIILSMVITASVVSIGMLLFGFNPSCLWLIPLVPPAVYGIGLLMTLCLTEGGILIGMLLRAVVKYLYDEINIRTDADIDFYWTDYFWLAFCWLSLGFLTFLATIIIVARIKGVRYIFRPDDGTTYVKV